jgi:hypothetical protein
VGLKSQYQIKMKQREKRRKARKKMAAKGENPNDYFYAGYYIKSAEKQ